MSINQLRSSIRAWLTSLVRIDAWDLDVPSNVPTVLGDKRYPANVAVEMPVTDLSLKKADSYIEGKGQFVYPILYRFSGKAAKEQLPVKAVESLVNYLCERAVQYPQELWEDITGLEINNIADPVTLARIEGEDGDWLIIARLEFDITFVSDAQADFDNLQPISPDDPAIAITRIDIGLNRSDIPVTQEPGTFVLDRLIQVPISE